MPTKFPSQQPSVKIKMGRTSEAASIRRGKADCRNGTAYLEKGATSAAPFLAVLLLIARATSAKPEGKKIAPISKPWGPQGLPLKPALTCFVIISIVLRHWRSRLAFRPAPNFDWFAAISITLAFRLALRPSLCACGLKFWRQHRHQLLQVQPYLRKFRLTTTSRVARKRQFYALGSEPKRRCRWINLQTHASQKPTNSHLTSLSPFSRNTRNKQR